MRFPLQLFAVLGYIPECSAAPPRSIAASVEDHVAEHLEVFHRVVVAVNVVKAGEDGQDRPPFGQAHILLQMQEAVDGAADRDQQQANVDKDGDAERDVVALAEPGRLFVKPTMACFAARARDLYRRRGLVLQRVRRQPGD